MEKARYHQFLNKILPALNQLNESWFPPGEKSPDGYHYACTYCDMECGGHERHDRDCFADLAKQALLHFKQTDERPSFDIDFQGTKRTLQDSIELRMFSKVRYVLANFCGPNLMSLIPIDYSSPENKHIVCSCNFFSEHHERRHQDDCFVQIFAKALAELLKIE